MSSVSPHRSRFPQQGSAFSVLAFHHGVVGQVVGRGARVAALGKSLGGHRRLLPCPALLPSLVAAMVGLTAALHQRPTMVGSTGSIMGPRAAIWLPPMQTGVKAWQDGRTGQELRSYLPQPAECRARRRDVRGGVAGSQAYHYQGVFITQEIWQSDIFIVSTCKVVSSVKH